MKKGILFLASIFLLSAPLTAQEKYMSKKPKRITYEQITAQMTSQLQLDEKQQKKIAKLNKKYKTLIEGEHLQHPQGQRPSQGEHRSGIPGDHRGPGSFGGGMPSGGFGGHGGPRGFGGAPSQDSTYDYDKKQQKYDKAISKILSKQQYDGYLRIKSQFASQRRIRDFLMGGQQPWGEGMPPAEHPGNLPSDQNR